MPPACPAAWRRSDAAPARAASSAASSPVSAWAWSGRHAPARSSAPSPASPSPRPARWRRSRWSSPMPSEPACHCWRSPLGGRAAHGAGFELRIGLGLGHPGASAILVLVTAGLMAVGADTAISADLTSALPDWTGTLQTLERTEQVQSALSTTLRTRPDPAGPSGLGRLDRPESGLPVGPAAPEFTGIDNWLNSEPLTMAGLRGKVVLVDFWTYSCINCIRTLPYVEGWYQKYAAEGLVDRRRAQPGVRLRARHRQRRGRDRPLRDHVSGGAGQRILHLERLQQPVLAGRLPDRRDRPRAERTSAKVTTSRPRRRSSACWPRPGAAPSALPTPAASAAPVPIRRQPDAGDVPRHGPGQSFASPQNARPARPPTRSPTRCRTTASRSAGTFDFEPQYALATSRRRQARARRSARATYTW